MQTSYFAQRKSAQDIIYSKGFYAFLCGAVLIGALLGTLSLCLGQESALSDITAVGRRFIMQRKGMDDAAVLTGSLGSATLLLGAQLVFGLCAVGQPVAAAVPVFRGMGIGLTLAQLYTQAGKSGVLPAMGLILPSEVICVLALIAGAREAAAMSCEILSHTLAERQVEGLAEQTKLYLTRFMVLEACLALSAAADCAANHFLIGYF
ncbi:MAG: stage II sporulation protein M [Ruminococcus sp.]|nr:stage II sporulation protein M [Ruminococcus sp.]